MPGAGVTPNGVRTMTNRVAKELAETLPQPKGPFTDAEALELLMAYRKDLDVPAPCGPDSVEAGLHRPQIAPNGFRGDRARGSTRRALLPIYRRWVIAGHPRGPLLTAERRR